MNNAAVLFSFLLFSFSSFGQDTSAYRIQTNENQFVYSGNTVKIFVGEKIHISAKSKSGKLKELKLVDTAVSDINDFSKLMIYVLKQNNEKDIWINYNVVQGEDGKPQTVLIVNNPYKKTLSYKAKYFSKKQNQYVETSINDVMPGISGIELWPYTITDFILYDFVLKD